MTSPLERFLLETLQEFERDRLAAGLREGPVEHRLRGARQFVDFLSGRPPRKGERTTESPRGQGGERP